MKTYAPVLIAALALLAFLAPASSQENRTAEECEEEVIITDCGKVGGWEIEELLRTVGQYTERSIVYDPNNPRIANAKIEFVGPQRVPRERLFEWLQSLLSFQRLILVPVGIGDQWMVVDMLAAQVPHRPIFIPEGELGEWKDRRGVYILTSITMTRERDAVRALDILAPFATPKVGQVRKACGAATLVIGDFAPKVAAMVRTARAVEAGAESRADGIRRYEELLAAAETETAAAYFLSRIEKIRAREEE